MVHFFYVYGRSIVCDLDMKVLCSGSKPSIPSSPSCVTFSIVCRLQRGKQCLPINDRQLPNIPPPRCDRFFTHPPLSQSQHQAETTQAHQQAAHQTSKHGSIRIKPTRSTQAESHTHGGRRIRSWRIRSGRRRRTSQGASWRRVGNILARYRLIPT